MFESTIAYFSQFWLIVLIPRPNPIGIRHVVLVLAREGMWQSAIAVRWGLTPATVNHILRKHVATRTLVPGKSIGAPRKTTPHQDRALLRMARQHRFINAQALVVRMRNLYGMRAVRKTINNKLLSRGYCDYRPTRKPLLTANHRCLHLEWAQMCQAYWVQAGGGSVHVWGAFHSGDKSPLVLPDRYLTSELCRSILRNSLVPFARQHFGDNYHYQDDNATRRHLQYLWQTNMAAWLIHRNKTLHDVFCLTSLGRNDPYLGNNTVISSLSIDRQLKIWITSRLK